MDDEIQVELVFAAEDTQRLVAVSMPPGATVAQAIESSGLADHFPGEDFDKLPVGIWGHVVPRDQVLRAGDRVEIYRPLKLDPRQARRQLAELGRTMGSSTSL